MIHQSATSNCSDTGADVTFKEAARLVGVAWRKKYGCVPVPVLSHALSDYDGTTWKIACAETGGLIAVVINGNPVLTEDLDDLLDEALA